MWNYGYDILETNQNKTVIFSHFHLGYHTHLITNVYAGMTCVYFYVDFKEHTNLLSNGLSPCPRTGKFDIVGDKSQFIEASTTKNKAKYVQLHDVR